MKECKITISELNTRLQECYTKLKIQSAENSNEAQDEIVQKVFEKLKNLFDKSEMNGHQINRQEIITQAMMPELKIKQGR